MAAKKFYAVKVGKTPGIYKTWEDCKSQVHGFQGALYKSFLSLEEAECYLAGNPAPAQADSPPPGSEKHYDIYVDGSYLNHNYGWAFVVYRDATMIHCASGVGQDAGAAATRNIAGELEATMQAVTWAKDQDIDCITIHHDYIGISEWAVGHWKTNNPVTRDYAKFIAPYLGWVKFNKVAGHTGVDGNEAADKLAKEALRQL